jgi:hypothetical protein
VAVLTCAAAPLAPANAETVDVTLGALGGTRQFAVEDISGNPLTAINLGTGGTQPFRTRVVDESFTSVSEPYTVSATMSNLYLKSGASYAWGTKVPSSELSLVYPTNPLQALGVAFPVVPDLSLSGTLPTCASLPSNVKTALGLSVAGLTSDLAVTALCTALGSGLTVTPVGTPSVDGLVQQVTAAATNLLNIPTQLTGATTGSFDSADYGADTIGFSDPAKPATNTPSSLQIMHGTPNLTDALKAEIASKLSAALSALPLTTANNVGADTTLASVVSSLSSSTDTGVAALGTALATLDAAKQSALVNLLTSAVVPVSMSNLPSLSGQYYGFPSLKATPLNMQPGEYAGTLTVTFVQQ